MDVHEYSYLNLYLEVDIRRGWNAQETLPRVLTILYNGRKIHLQPYWMMEFWIKIGVEDSLELKIS